MIVNCVNGSECSAMTGVNYVNGTEGSARVGVVSSYDRGKSCQWNRRLCTGLSAPSCTVTFPQAFHLPSVGNVLTGKFTVRWAEWESAADILLFITARAPLPVVKFLF